jgi:hypothetical protein
MLTNLARWESHGLREIPVVWDTAKQAPYISPGSAASGGDAYVRQYNDS